MWEIPGRNLSFETIDLKHMYMHTSVLQKSLNIHANEFKKKQTRIELYCVHVDQVLLDQYTLHIYIQIYIYCRLIVILFG